jgi:hypothetical protein
MPVVSFQCFIDKIRQKNRFPRTEASNAAGQMGIALEIVILGSMRYLVQELSFQRKICVNFE